MVDCLSIAETCTSLWNPCYGTTLPRSSTSFQNVAWVWLCKWQQVLMQHRDSLLRYPNSKLSRFRRSVVTKCPLSKTELANIKPFCWDTEIPCVKFHATIQTGRRPHVIYLYSPPTTLTYPLTLIARKSFKFLEGRLQMSSCIWKGPQ